jgi:hypothetical protein
MPKFSLDLQSLGGMIVVHVFDLMPKHKRKLVFALELIKQTCANKDVPARQGKGIDEIAVVEKMEMPGKIAFGMSSYVTAGLVDVLLQRTLLRGLGGASRRVLFGELVADLCLFGVGDTGEAHGDTGHIVLPIRHHIYEGISADRVVPGMALS